MKNTTLLFFFIIFSFPSFSQVVEAKIDYYKKIKWDPNDKDFYRASENMLSENPSSIVRLAYDKITLISEDTMNLFLNEAPQELEDSIIVQRIWYKVVDDYRNRMYAHLIYFKNTEKYMLRVLNQETDKGVEYYVTPINQPKPVGKKKKY